MFVTTAPLAEITGLSGVKIEVYAEALHEPAFLVFGLVAGSGHGAGMSDGPRQLRFPASDDAGHDRLGEFDAALVVASGLGVEHSGLAPDVVVQGMREIARRIMDVDVLAGGDQGSSTPTFGGEILGNGGGEAA